ncbi:hypothetical protein GC170_11835, partial [bacterium]|nr:hypothetical protein [bacterium]
MATHDPQQATPRGRMLEYAEFVEDQVARACARIKNNDMFRATLWLVTVGLAVLFLEIVLDHTVELPLVARRTVLYGGLLAGAVYAGLRIVRPMFLRVNDLYAAKSIESVDPHFKNSLINYLRLREDADKIPPSVLKSIEARAVNDLTAVNVDDVVDPSPVTQLSYALAAIVVGLCLYSWITPKNIWDSARRAFLADVARPTNTRFANVSPGEDPDAPKVITGLPVNFSVETLGAQPDTVTLFTSRDGGKSFAETPMAKGRSFADPWTVTIEKAPGEMLYYMAGGDGRTRSYELKALPVALVESVTLDFEFPAYAKAPRREGVTDGNVEALQGTRVTVTAVTNQPARSGLLDFGPRPPVTLVPLPGEPRKLKGTFVVEANGQYSVRFNTVDGQTNPEPVLYDIRVVKDVPPTARFIRPETPTQRPANARVPLVIEATDDFGITSAQLHVYKGGEILQQAVELIDPKSKEALKQIQTTIALDLKPLSLRDGDRIQYWLTLKDNCELQTNRFETAKQEIVIQPPVTEPERDQLAQNEMAQAKEELGQQEPQPEDQPGQQGQDSQTGEGQKGQEKQGENQSKDQQRSSEDQKKNDQGKQGQGKSGQGNESESAEPGDNAKSGGPQGKGQQKPSDGSAKGKNDPGKGQSGQGGENSKDGRQPQGKPGERNQGQGGDNSESKSEPGKNAPKDASKQDQQNSERTGEQEKKGQQGRDGNREQGKNSTGERPPGGEETGKAEPGRKPDATERSTEKSGERSKGDQEKSNRPEPGDQSKGQQGESGQDKSSEKSKSGERKDGQPGANEKGEAGEKGEPDGLPKGEPEKGEPNENARQRSLDELTKQDREKLDRLRKALGMDDQPKPEDGQPGQGEENPAGYQAKSDDQRKGERSKSGGQDKGDQSKSGGQEKGEAGQDKGDQSKSGGQEK